MPVHRRSAVTWKPAWRKLRQPWWRSPRQVRGTRQITEEAALERAAEAVLVTHRVMGPLTSTSPREQAGCHVCRARMGWGQPLIAGERASALPDHCRDAQRGGDGRPRVDVGLVRLCSPCAEASRVSAASRRGVSAREYDIEQGFGRLKGAPLSMAPLCVKRDDQVTGSTHLLRVA